jgi:molybdate transport system substrate-binding protein
VLIAALGVLAATLGCSNGKERGRVLTVAAAADLRFAFDDTVQQFERQHPDIHVEVSYGSSGKFYSQLTERAPFDLYLSADVDYPRRLADKGLGLKDSLFVYAVGHLVVWVPPDSPVDVEKRRIQALLDPAVRKVAIANPKVAPYGRAAEAALRNLKVYDQVKERLVLGENVAQAAQFVKTGAAQAGIIPLSLARAPAMQAGRYAEIPPEAYPRLEQGGIILSWAKDRQAAEALRAFVLSADGQAVLERYGFSAPGK